MPLEHCHGMSPGLQPVHHHPPEGSPFPHHGVRQVPEGSGEQGEMEKTGCKIICGAPMTLAVKGFMMMMYDYVSSSLFSVVN